MLIFGHAGITLGATVLLNSALTKGYSLRGDRTPGSQGSSKGRSPFEFMSSPSLCQGERDKGGSQENRRFFWVLKGGEGVPIPIDIRLLLVGSLLSDIIDKPIGQFFFRETFSNGRIFCHTLLFLMLLTVAGLYFYRRHSKTWLLVFSFATLTHFIFDQMWLEPRTLLWPLYGFAFEKIDLTYWLQNILYALRTDPGVYMPELIGTAILIWFAGVLVRRKKVYTFIRNG